MNEAKPIINGVIKKNVGLEVNQMREYESHMLNV